MDNHPRKDFDYRQLKNNLNYISESIIQSFKAGKCQLKAWAEEPNYYDPRRSYYEIQADMEKAFVEIVVYFEYPDDGYLIRIWDKNIPASEKDEKTWNVKNKEALCPGHLTWEYEDDKIIDGEQGIENPEFDSDIHSLIHEYVKKLHDFYFSVESVTPILKDLL